MNHKVIYILLAVLLVGCGKHDNIAENIQPTNQANNGSLSVELPNFTDLYKTVESEVVTIHAESLQSFSKPSTSNRNGKSLELRKSLGSGFIISPDGYIVTSAHVVMNQQNILVTLNNKQDLSATVIGIDDNTDIALLKISGESLPFVKISGNISQVGDWVAAVGSPYGFIGSLTAGVISSTTRQLANKIQEDGKSIIFLQTDVPTNPGSSGSPLFNLSGEVIGMSSLIYSPDPGYSGISFALPIDLVMCVVNNLQADAELSNILRPFGIQLSRMKDQLVRKIGIQSGLLVTDLKPQVESSGLVLGDVVLEINNQNVSDLSRVNQMLKGATAVTLLVLRNGQRLYITLKHD